MGKQWLGSGYWAVGSHGRCFEDCNKCGWHFALERLDFLREWEGRPSVVYHDIVGVIERIVKFLGPAFEGSMESGAVDL